MLLAEPVLHLSNSSRAHVLLALTVSPSLKLSLKSSDLQATLDSQSGESKEEHALEMSKFKNMAERFRHLAAWPRGSVTLGRFACHLPLDSRCRRAHACVCVWGGGGGEEGEGAC